MMFAPCVTIRRMGCTGGLWAIFTPKYAFAWMLFVCVCGSEIYTPARSVRLHQNLHSARGEARERPLHIYLFILFCYLFNLNCVTFYCAFTIGGNGRLGAQTLLCLPVTTSTPQQAARPQWSHHANWALFGGILNKAHFNWWFAYRSCFFLLLCCLPLCKKVVLLCAFCICVLCLSRFSLCRSRMRAQKLYQLDGVVRAIRKATTSERECSWGRK